jgi:hypothetical protein
VGKRDCAHFRLGYQEDRVKRKHNLEGVWTGGKKGGSRLWITSLNSHFCSGDNGTTCWYGAKRARVWIKVCDMQFPTDLVGLQIITLE